MVQICSSSNIILTFYLRDPQQQNKISGSKSVRECGWHLLNFITFVLCHIIANSTHNSCAFLLMLIFSRHLTLVLLTSCFAVSLKRKNMFCENIN